MTTTTSSSAQRVRVLIADPDGLARRMITNALRNHPNMIVLAAVSDPRETLELTRHYQPDILIIDSTLTTDHGTELLHQAKTASPHTRILAITANPDQPTAIETLRAGADGHINKDLNPDHLAQLVTRAAAGEAIVPRNLVTALLDQLQQIPENGWRPLHSRLTTREWEIIELLAQNNSTEQIADTLVLSIETVYSHVKNLLRKLNVTHRHEAVIAAQHLRQQEIQTPTLHTLTA